MNNERQERIDSKHFASGQIIKNILDEAIADGCPITYQELPEPQKELGKLLAEEFYMSETNQIIHERLMGECWHEIVESCHGLSYYTFDCTKCDYSEETADVEKDSINPKYDSDLNLAFAAQAKAIERFGASEYINALDEAIKNTKENGLIFMQDIIECRAETRCAAMVKLLENEK